MDLLITGVLIHDIGKLREYVRKGPDFSYDHLNSLVGHMSLGVEMIKEKIALIPDFPHELEVLLKHYILSHHGKREYGSPVTPYTIEAELIHMADTKSATVQQWVMTYQQVAPLDGEAMIRADKLSGEPRLGGRNIFGRNEMFDRFWEE